MAGRLNLKDVTICTADSANVMLSARALELSMRHCDFGDAVLFSHAPVDGPYRTVKIDKFNTVTDYSDFRLKRLPEFLDAPFVLSVEWDGYVIDPRAWNPAFLDYDYIGARWPQYSGAMTVGNSGFCLQSRKFLAALTDPRFVSKDKDAMDILACRVYRPILERDFGIRFAPESLANHFSYELAILADPTFGFHGCGNMWRYNDDVEMTRLIDLFDPYVFRGEQYGMLVIHYFFQRKYLMLEKAYPKLRQSVPDVEMIPRLTKLLNSKAQAQEMFATCERLMARSSAAIV